MQFERGDKQDKRQNLKKKSSSIFLNGFKGAVSRNSAKLGN